MGKYTPKELKTAVQELNAVLETGKIKVVGKTTVAIEEAFRETIVNMIEEEKVAVLPETVIDFYNNYIADDEGEEGEGETEEKPAPTKKPAGKTATKPTAGKTATKPTAGKTATKPTAGKTVVKKTVVKKSTAPATEEGGKSGKKDGKKSSRTRSRDGNGVVAKAVEAYQTLNIRDTKALTAHLTEMFPDRPIASTVSHVCCILAHVKDI